MNTFIASFAATVVVPVTAALAAGIALSLLADRRPARAHAALLAAVPLTPTLSPSTGERGQDLRIGRNST